MIPYYLRAFLNKTQQPQMNYTQYLSTKTESKF